MSPVPPAVDIQEAQGAAVVALRGELEPKVAEARTLAAEIERLKAAGIIN